MRREHLPTAVLLKVLFRTPEVFSSACLIHGATTMARRDQLRQLREALTESTFARPAVDGRLAQLQRTLERLDLRGTANGMAVVVGAVRGKGRGAVAVVRTRWTRPLSVGGRGAAAPPPCSPASLA